VVVGVLALASVGARADEWSGVAKAYAADANAGCAEAEAALADCKNCSKDYGQRGYSELLRAFCVERERPAQPKAAYEAIVRDFPDSFSAEHAMLRVVALARGPEPAQPVADEAGRPALDVMPVVRVNPSYPGLPWHAGIEGWVLRFDVLSNGRVLDLHVIESNPPFLFDLSAALAVSRWYYKPGAREGV
jgi:TonB family protein